jgi:HD-GYP domain-containing protein (c-di-GMP phosphodiesterase class II)
LGNFRQEVLLCDLGFLIIAVADVFDALTSQRPYKRAWSNAEAVAVFERMAGAKLDHEWVAALIDHTAEVEEIRNVFVKIHSV